MKLKIEKLDHFGRGVTHIDSKVCFVDDALPSEVVEIEIVKEAKKFLLGKVTGFYKQSEKRAKPLCPYYGVCGGCNLEHLSIDEENRFKQDKVKEILKRFGDIDEELVQETKSVNEYFYRNKIVLHGDGEKLGLYEMGSNRIVDISRCLLVDEKINQVIGKINSMPNKTKISEALIRVSNDSSKVMVSLKGKKLEVSDNLRDLSVIVLNDQVISDDSRIISSIGNKKYYVSAGSFFQVNKELTKLLYDEVLNVVRMKMPKKVLDLYCGTGTIGIYISDLVDEVIGVDYSVAGINDAKENAKLNNVSNVRFICDKVENVIDEFSSLDLVVVDPPRSGLDSKTIENIKRIAADNLVYISCDPVTLARDLKMLSSSYEVGKVIPYNMFPRTYHVECVCVLNRR